MYKRARGLWFIQIIASFSGGDTDFYGDRISDCLRDTSFIEALAGMMLLICTAFIAGLLFGLGLLVSGMANPVKVLNFLDITGNWDPSLALVMVGAILVGLITFTIAKKRAHSFLGEPMKWPTARLIDHRLIIGSALFGVGWGIAGICPGPSFIAVSMGESKAVIFIIAMLAGMIAFDLLERR